MTNYTKTNGDILYDHIVNNLDKGWMSPYAPVNRLAKSIGWGWHRTNNALKELGYR